MTNDPGSFSITYSALEAAEQQLRAAHSSAQSTIEDLIAQLDQGLADWDGDAKEAYLRVKVQWNKAFADMSAVVQVAANHLANTNDLMRTTERNSSSIWGG
jgi:WXG100 family type VII secretion target